MTDILTDFEKQECEIECSYGDQATSIHIDHKGRIFASSDGPLGGHNECVIFNEFAAGRESVARLHALCEYWLAQQ